MKKTLFSAEKEFAFSSPSTAKAAVKALKPELQGRFSSRSKVTINTNKNLVSLKVVARDRRSCNATLASYTRLLGMCIAINRLEER